MSRKTCGKNANGELECIKNLISSISNCKYDDNNCTYNHIIRKIVEAALDRTTISALIPINWNVTGDMLALVPEGYISIFHVLLPLVRNFNKIKVNPKIIPGNYVQTAKEVAAALGKSQMVNDVEFMTHVIDAFEDADYDFDDKQNASTGLKCHVFFDEVLTSWLQQNGSKDELIKPNLSNRIATNTMRFSGFFPKTFDVIVNRYYESLPEYIGAIPASGAEFVNADIMSNTCPNGCTKFFAVVEEGNALGTKFFHIDILHHLFFNTPSVVKKGVPYIQVAWDLSKLRRVNSAKLPASSTAATGGSRNHSEKIAYKGKSYKVRTGKAGGRYIVAAGKKRYV
jgi:hypothetical protein